MLDGHVNTYDTAALKNYTSGYPFYVLP